MTRTRTIGVLGAVLGVLLGIAGCAATTSAATTPAPPKPAAAAGAQAPPTAGAGSCHSRGALPDAVCTPGEADPRVRADTLQSTICSAGWAKQTRPPVQVTKPIKKERFRAYAVTTPLQSVELDHRVPIALGGNTSVANLWPQPWDGTDGAHVKDVLEARLAAMVCAGQLPLATAQHDIATDWVAAYHKYVGPN
jgi:hypothetical protein